ncbi:hypothetical protein CC1G_11094 [Coprinopsis cinerea okayama7|uniref:Uncharacterized protein n=1 Tax=Coprinopsis cinerea (strain Okayama-7 / 130 / ATCC MYA-4618 / FGSC 9003) TaxID=240176 RepID=A8P7M8_COPC7|nr:hypothetical protein CC1G_11094 [Coprinopsis cinerea okayama7\|eukprot:XP_001839394.2 hypothetical protein CC1G_11094 [Coprinopsis cinerea okayama7\
MSTQPMSAEALKDLATQQFRERKYREAIATYSTIINRSRHLAEPPVPVPLLRVVLLNRAQCYINIKDYDSAVNDCLRVLQRYHSSRPEDAQLMKKVHWRLGKSYFNLDMLDEAMEQKRLYDQLNLVFSGVNFDIPSSLARPQASKTYDEFIANVDARPFRFEVRVIRGGAERPKDDPDFVYTEQAPVDLCRLGGMMLEMKAIQFANSVIDKHYDEILGSEPRWKCCLCAKEAPVVLHRPQPSLDHEPPFVVDIVYPLCEDGGKCHKDAAKMHYTLMCLEGTFGKQDN